jgi:endonuclease YncB( thermonuclease family)
MYEYYVRKVENVVDGDTESLNDKMINDGYAWGYMGDTKVKDFDALEKARKKSGK